MFTRRWFLAALVAGSLLAGSLPSAPVGSAQDGCTFRLGFLTLYQMIPHIVGDCVSDEGHNPTNGDGLQLTTGGLLVWRKADNWTAFTDGTSTWINGPDGLAKRPNEGPLFSWEADPGYATAVADSPIVPDEPAPPTSEEVGPGAGAPGPPPAVANPTTAPSAPAPTTSLRWTPRPAGEFIYGALLANPSATASLARSAGFTHMWSYVSWKKVEPRRGRFLFKTKNQWGQTTANDLTNVLTAARKAGLQLVLRVVDPPDWAGGSVHRLHPEDVEDYVYEVVRYGRGTISFVEVFNEPNLPREWGSAPDPAAYVRLLAAANRGVKRADPHVTVVSAGVSGRTGGLNGAMEDVDWLDGFYRAGAREHFDMLGMHAYIGGLPPESDPGCTPLCFRTLELWRAVMEKHGDGRKSAFITETGALEKSSRNQGAYEWMELPSDKRAQYLVNALRLANANYAWIAGAMVFNLDYATTSWNPPSSEHHWFSLLNPDKSPRPAYSAIKQARRDGTLP